ncbi:MAG: hypothetical protein WCH57_02605 [Verrucomicrobiota bacterium]
MIPKIQLKSGPQSFGQGLARIPWKFGALALPVTARLLAAAALMAGGAASLLTEPYLTRQEQGRRHGEKPTPFRAGP